MDKWTQERRTAMIGRTSIGRVIKAMLIGRRRARVNVDEEIAKEMRWLIKTMNRLETGGRYAIHIVQFLHFSQ